MDNWQQRKDGIYGLVYPKGTAAAQVDAWLQAQLGSKTVSLSGETGFHSDLSIKANAALLRQSMSAEKQTLFDALLDLTKWKKQPHRWGHAFRKDMGGEKTVYAAICSVLCSEGTLLLREPLPGMDAKLRAIFPRFWPIVGSRAGASSSAPPPSRT